MENRLLREKILARLGRFPSKVPLEAVFEEPVDEGEYTRTRVTYMVEPGEITPAWLLRPQGEKPKKGWPAILAIHRDSERCELGKGEVAGISGDPMYHYGREICLRGYVVLCPDLLCYEERRPSEEIRRRRTALMGENYERFEFTKRLQKGSSLQAKYLHDLACSLDLLSSLPEVDKQNLGVIGHSLGGLEALWLTWYDARVMAGVASCGLTLVKSLLRDGLSQPLVNCIPGLLDVADMDDLLGSLAPTPFMMVGGEQDPLLPIDGFYFMVNYAQSIYIQLGVPERFRYLVFQGGHVFPPEARETAYLFLDRWLKPLPPGGLLP
jgi:dienelactone hydrolase